MAKKLYPDKWLFAATVGLALFGVVMVYSASAVMAQRENGTQYYYVIKQIILTVIMLLAVFAFGRINGAHRWIKFGSFRLKPSEISKLVLALFLAYFLE